LHISCSVGITITRSGEIEPVEVLRQADIALYRAKEEGRGRFSLFEPEMDVAIKSRRVLEGELRGALARGELAMHYQPQVDQQGKMIGLEALVRWFHPERGEITPSYFVPIAEQSGLILDLGLFALRRAFEDSHRWPGLKIAVNISANQIRDKSFITKLGALVRETRVNANHFDLEITEGILLGDDPETQTRLHALNKMGFGLALDDFGTGYSSLSYLHRYPIGKIKIDRSFIANLGIEAEADAVVDAIVKLARALGLGVVAEGVETAAQFAHLKAAGCAELQGFLFSQAVSADSVDTLRAMTPRAKRSRHQHKLAV
jgi:predicted signal transduction protein with EAL and GGDEF domain